MLFYLQFVVNYLIFNYLVLYYFGRKMDEKVRFCEIYLKRQNEGGFTFIKNCTLHLRRAWFEIVFEELNYRLCQL